MAHEGTPIQVSLRGILCRDLLEMIASGTNVGAAVTQIISDLLNAPSGKYSVRLVGGVFVFEKIADPSPSPSNLFQ